MFEMHQFEFIITGSCRERLERLFIVDLMYAPWNDDVKLLIYVKLVRWKHFLPWGKYYRHSKYVSLRDYQ